MGLEVSKVGAGRGGATTTLRRTTGPQTTGTKTRGDACGLSSGVGTEQGTVFSRRSGGLAGAGSASLAQPESCCPSAGVVSDLPSRGDFRRPGALVLRRSDRGANMARAAAQARSAGSER